MPGTLFLIDGHYQIYRSFFGMPTLTNSGGRPVHVAYAISDLLLRLRRDLKAERWAIALDSPGPTFRHREGSSPSGTRSKREEMPRELREQLPWVEEILEGFRIPVLRADGYEADDIIATLCGWAEEHGLDVRILSKDKDLEQLLTDRVKLVDEKSGRLYGPRELLEKKGITPEQVVAYQSLTGDSSDNIPGVPGIGPKTAAKILRSIADLDRLLEDPAPEGVPPRALERIRENRGSMQLSRRLAELARDVPLPAEESGYRVLSPDEERLRPLFRSLGLQRFLKMLDSEAEGGRGDPPAPVGGGAAEAPSAAEPAAEGAARYLLVEDLACLDGVLEECRRAGRFAFDTETTGLDPIVDRAVGFSLAARAGEAWYVPLESPSGRPPMAREEVLRRLRPLLEDRGVGKIGQNIKYDALVLQGDGITLRGIVFDPRIAAYLINPLRGSYKLDELVGERLGHTMIPIHEIIGPRGEERSMAQIEPQEICEYAAEDADYTLRLAEELEPEIGELGLKRVYEQLELPLIEVLVAMELEGITLDLGRLEEQEEAISRSLEEQEAEIHRLAGEAFNVKSPKQLQEVLFQRLGLPALRKIKTGYSTSAGVLEELASLHPEQPLPER
ncbi:MAG: DNA polymerase, partial [Planctomycetota bacterium]